MADIIHLFRDFYLMHTKKKTEKDETGHKEKEVAEEFRKASLETFRQPQKGTASDDEGSSKNKKNVRN